MNLSDIFGLSESDLTYAKELRSQGLNNEQIGKEVRWRQEIGRAVAFANVASLENDSGPVERLKTKLHNAEKQIAELQDRLAAAETERDKARQAHAEDRLMGKSRQTFLKVVLVAGAERGFVVGTPNGAVSSIQKALVELDVDAEDDEAIRNVFKEAFGRKHGGYWSMKRD